MMPYMSLCVVMIDLGNLRDQIFFPALGLPLVQQSGNTFTFLALKNVGIGRRKPLIGI